MRYVSTRAASADASEPFSDILLEGLAPDGGLYLPVTYPRVDAQTLTRWRAVLAEQGYAALAAEVIGLYIDDIGHDDLLELCRRAYTAEKFGDPQIVPVTRIGDEPLWLGHLSNGPTAAFKDMAMQLLGEFFEYELRRRSSWLTIVGATSGDTGSSAEYAMRGRDGLSVVMLTPAGRMTPFQQAQMFGLQDPNIINVAVDGVFDTCQDLVKALNADAEFKHRWHVGAVNSINWARLVAQVVYYFACWLRVTTSADEQISFAVPTGNFGNVCAGHIARSMGLPIKRLIVATNENDVLDEFFHTGRYRVRGAVETVATSSPSMDISKASNFERFIADLFGRDGATVRRLFDQLARTGEFDISGTAQFTAVSQQYGFVSGHSSHADRLATIERLWTTDQILIDPHTADGVHVAEQFAGDEQIVVLETALPVKFADTIKEATGELPPVPPRFAHIGEGPRRVIEMGDDLGALKKLVADTVGTLRA
ncbi:threonine synthase [Propionibacterium freudenreichii]|uniref:threonine synthase n=1 Tax=Propionibacterium freudenreichii TaxID=1744 RepID=UPI0005419770|nr:threonine synthase [Propionibacterium freudenreichii]AJQ90513.1 Threonine synthase [Propionibacterium freudenreichii subsp. freudenreichii]MCT2999944.1 threonine synthase [Propionibacterium freudenreichii]MDK9341938.1 threonine synthase [Propionibacterium freudenreichii]MDK9660879.1 threonine synthase [Propionibacterium freudenreichii]CEG91633.1 Threonine synthase (O-phospho-L-homoserine phosphate-lyase (adding water, L-threonine-forming)) [Propionibacterium freudenreichii]